MTRIIQNNNTMTLHKKPLQVITAALLIFICSASLSQAQTIARVFNDINNSLIFRIENIDEEKTPTKILLVYDSNLITLESTSPTAMISEAGGSSYANYKSYRSAALLNSLMATEMEKELKLENWMLKPFDEAVPVDKIKTDLEEELALESWMTDLNSW